MKICVIGLGYVGLPLARLFSTKYETIGFDMTLFFGASTTIGSVIYNCNRCVNICFVDPFKMRVQDGETE